MLGESLHFPLEAFAAKFTVKEMQKNDFFVVKLVLRKQPDYLGTHSTLGMNCETVSVVHSMEGVVS